MNKQLIIITGILLFSLCIACTEEKIEPLPYDATIPGKVFDIEVENLPGAARLTYSLPEDRSLSYVEAVWTSSRGIISNARSSSYGNTLLLEGFGDTKEYEIKIYSVNRGEKKSEPVTVKIRPLTAPVFTVFEALKVSPNFGGCYTDYVNEAGADLVISVITPDTVDATKMMPVINHYTSRKTGGFYVRGFPPVSRMFGFFVKDRWDNRSDTMYKELTPIYEEELNKSKFKEYQLIGDINDNTYQRANKMALLWDNKLNTQYISWNYDGAPVMPNLSFAFDMGEPIRLSRFQLIQRYADLLSNAYNIANIKTFEVWGTNETPAADGSWDNWKKLLDCDIVKPSGLPNGILDDDDIAAVKAGHDYDFAADVPIVRYLRFKILSNWNGLPYIYISEMSFWGQKP